MNQNHTAQPLQLFNRNLMKATNSLSIMSLKTEIHNNKMATVKSYISI